MCGRHTSGYPGGVHGTQLEPPGLRTEVCFTAGPVTTTTAKEGPRSLQRHSEAREATVSSKGQAAEAPDALCRATPRACSGTNVTAGAFDGSRVHGTRPQHPASASAPGRGPPQEPHGRWAAGPLGPDPAAPLELRQFDVLLRRQRNVWGSGSLYGHWGQQTRQASPTAGSPAPQPRGLAVHSARFLSGQQNMQGRLLGWVPQWARSARLPTWVVDCLSPWMSHS